MKLQHYPETDSLYIELREPCAETRELAPGVKCRLRGGTGRSSASI
jgi:hypothetical protein